MADDNFTVVTDEVQTLDLADNNLGEEQTEEESAQNTDDTPTSEKEGAEAKEPDAKEGHSRYQKRIDKLVRQREEAERKAQQLEDELGYYKNNKPKEQSEDAKDISPLDYDSYEEYVEALSAQGKEKQVKQEQSAPQQDRAFDMAVKRLDDTFDEAREKYTDFDAVVTDPKAIITKEMVIALSDIDNAGEVAYYLAKNKDKAEAISKLSYTKQAVELGRLSDKLIAQPQKKVTNAPDPIEPVAGGGDVIQKDPSKMSFKEYETYMNNQTRKKGFW